MTGSTGSTERLQRLAVGVAFIFLLGAQAPQPSSDPVGSPDTIVVTGTPLTQAEARERARAFVRSTGVARGETPAARWLVPVCPRILGISETGVQAAEARLRNLAAQAGIDMARAPCDANLVITFAPDARAIVREVDRRAPRRLLEVDPGDRDALLNGNAPIRWWYSTETVGRQRQKARHLSAPRSERDLSRAGPGGGPGGGGSVIPDNIPTMMQYQDSNISTLAQRSLVSASIVIAEPAVVGMPLDSIVDFAALVGFAEIRDHEARPEGSILGLFGVPSTARQLTAQDMVFLRTLYRMPLDRQAMRHRGVLVREISAALSEGSEE